MQVHIALRQRRGYLYARQRAAAGAYIGDARNSETAVEFRYAGLCIHLDVLLPQVYKPCKSPASRFPASNNCVEGADNAFTFDACSACRARALTLQVSGRLLPICLPR